MPTLHQANFLPPPGLRNAHVQSTLPSLALWRWPVWRQSRDLRAASSPVLLDCGGGVRLSGLAAVRDVAAPWVLLLHGWLGDAQSPYVLSLGSQLFAQGYNVFRLNLRDHGGSEHLNPGLFHSCLLDEAIGAVQAMQRLYQVTNLTLAGFSLGGNFALRIAAHADAAGLRLRRVLAVCPALNPHASDAALASGPAIYRHYFLDKWKSVLRNKQRLFPQHYALDDLLRTRSITELTDQLVQRHAGYGGVHDYYDGYSLLGDTLRGVRVPSDILIAQDDPIVPAADVHLLADNDWLHITSSDYGGHCGFMTGWHGRRWVNQWASERLQSAAD